MYFSSALGFITRVSYYINVYLETPSYIKFKKVNINELSNCNEILSLV